MQANNKEEIKKQNAKKQVLKDTIAKLLKDERVKKNKSLLLFSYENSIASSALNYIERGLRDAQITTLWKILEAHKIKPSEFFKLIEENLPENWTLLDE